MDINTPLSDRLADALAREGYRGTLKASAGHLAIYALDNSIHEVPPDVVLWPRDQADLARALRVLALSPFAHLPIRPRGAGTGTNGQSLGPGVVIDCARYMTQSHSFDAEKRQITVAPGMVRDVLNADLVAHGLHFAPHTSTSSRATIGGMIGTDAAGTGALRHGRTADHVAALTLHRPDCEALQITGADHAAFPALLAQLAGKQALIAQHWPHDLVRGFSGYDLKGALHQPDTLDARRLVTGAEGTLGLVGEATLTLTPLPHHKALYVLRFADFGTALRLATPLRDLAPLYIETMDSHVQALAAARLPDWPALTDLLGDGGQVAVLVGLAAETASDLAQQIRALEATLPALKAQGLLGADLVDDAAQIARVLELRSRAVGLLAAWDGPGQPVPIIEDCAVPPAHMADFIAKLQDMLARHGLQAGMFGHLDCGVIHVRPALDLAAAQDRKALFEVYQQTIALVTAHRGVLWGEHGKGMRAAALTAHFPPEMLALFTAVKQAFDPKSRCNPGKLGEAAPLKLADWPLKGDAEQDRPIAAPFKPALACNGNALCQSARKADLMCPSFQATGDPLHSPRGRAALLRRWALGDQTVTADLQDALEGCLGCAACATACPVGVDIPIQKSAWLAHQGGAKGLANWLIARSEQDMRRLSRLPAGALSLARRISQLPWLDRLTGLTRPPLPTPDWQAQLAAEELVITTRARPAAWQAVIIHDSILPLTEPDLVIAAARLLKALGHVPVLFDPGPSGKAALVQGHVDLARRQRNLALAKLSAYASAGLPLLVLETSATLPLMGESASLLGDLPADSPQVQPIATWLARQDGLARLIKPGTACQPVTINPHCTEQALQPQIAQSWAQVFATLLIPATIQTGGCCGMAGSWGLKTRWQTESRHLWYRNWADRFLYKDSPVQLATGWSCRQQAQRQAALAVPHPLTYLAGLLT